MNNFIHSLNGEDYICIKMQEHKELLQMMQKMDEAKKSLIKLKMRDARKEASYIEKALIQNFKIEIDAILKDLR